MRRWAWLVIALTATAASARLTTFAWTNDPSWPAGTTVELCSNGVCAGGIVGTQHTLDVPIEPGQRFDAAARAVTPDGLLSDWAPLTQTWPALPIGLWAALPQDDTMGIALLTSTSRASTNSGNAGWTTPTINTSGADFLVITVSGYAGLPTIWNGTYITDSKGNTWTFVSPSGPNNYEGTAIAYCVPTSVGSDHTVSLAANTANSYTSVAFYAFSGIDQVAPYDTRTAATDVNQAGAITPDVSGELFISQASYGPYTTTATVDGGFTAIIEHGSSSGVRNGTGSAYLIASDLSAQNPTWSMGTAANKGISLTAFMPAVSGAIALPRRALDGPLFGALRGSVR